MHTFLFLKICHYSISFVLIQIWMVLSFASYYCFAIISTTKNNPLPKYLCIYQACILIQRYIKKKNKFFPPTLSISMRLHLLLLAISQTMFLTPTVSNNPIQNIYDQIMYQLSTQKILSHAHVHALFFETIVPQRKQNVKIDINLNATIIHFKL